VLAQARLVWKRPITAKKVSPRRATGTPPILEYWLVVTLRQLTTPPPAGQVRELDDV
jgi:hypothetical protein